MADPIVVMRSIAINAPVARITEFIIDFHNWVDWSPWEGLDPDLQRTYSGPDSGVGASYAWSGNRKAGAGNMTIEAVQPTAIDVALNFTKPFKSRSQTRFDLEPTAEGTTVTWQVRTPSSLMLKVMSIFMSLEKTIGPDLEKGLAQLKTVAERPA